MRELVRRLIVGGASALPLLLLLKIAEAEREPVEPAKATSIMEAAR